MLIVARILGGLAGFGLLCTTAAWTVPFWIGLLLLCVTFISIVPDILDALGDL